MRVNQHLHFWKQPSPTYKTLIQTPKHKKPQEITIFQGAFFMVNDFLFWAQNVEQRKFYCQLIFWGSINNFMCLIGVLQVGNGWLTVDWPSHNHLNQNSSLSKVLGLKWYNFNYENKLGVFFDILGLCRGPPSWGWLLERWLTLMRSVDKKLIFVLSLEHKMTSFLLWK